MKKTIKIGSKEILFKSSAAIPRLYRIKFRRDIFQDFMQLEKEFKKNKGGKGSMSIPSLEIFENVAYLMSKHADPTQPNNVDEWLSQFEFLDIYTVLPEILKLWNLDNQTLSRSKKNNKK